MRLQGKAVSPGYAVGEAYCYERAVLKAPQTYLESGEAEAAWQIFLSGRQAAIQELERLKEQPGTAESAKRVMAAHTDILKDRALEKAIRKRIEQERRNALWAVELVYDHYKQIMENAKDPLFRERAADFEDTKGRLLRCCQGIPEQDLSTLGKPVILVCGDLMPSDTANLDREHVLAIVTQVGGETSHSAILARNYGIPAVLGVPDVMRQVCSGDTVAVDGADGSVFVRPDEQICQNYRQKRERYLEQVKQDAVWKHVPCRTADGAEVEICLNIASDDALDGENLEGIHGVGLLRTEFLYMHSDHLSTEEEQMRAYQHVLQAAKGKPVILRTLDIGGDKTLDYFELPRENNPFLGERAIRLCLHHLEIFQTQLRAALRASVSGELWLMFPMIGSMEDIHAVKKQLEQARHTLEERGQSYGANVKVGIMIEIPSIAILADQAAQEVDFASIGSNDLVQYLEAADRMNPAVARYYESWSPAVYRLIGLVSREFEKAGKVLSVCGEMAGDPEQAMILAGLGLRKLSMNPGMVSQVKKALAQYPLSRLRELAQAACQCGSAEEVHQLFQA